MKFKPGVNVSFNPTILRILEVWEKVCIECISVSYEPTVISGVDGDHALDGGHPHARAIDFCSRDIDFELRQPLRAAAQEQLGSDYLVILEPTHFHIQKNHA